MYFIDVDVMLKLNFFCCNFNFPQPMVSRRNTKNELEWRIRNLPYPIETYSVTCDDEKNTMTVRTTNKKYFKNLRVPELDRLGLKVEQSNVSFVHKYNTLIISVKILDLPSFTFYTIKDFFSIKNLNSC